MKILVFSIIMMLILGCSSPGETGNRANLVESLQPFVSQVIAELDMISPGRFHSPDVLQ